MSSHAYRGGREYTGLQAAALKPRPIDKARKWLFYSQPLFKSDGGALDQDWCCCLLQSSLQILLPPFFSTSF